MRFIAVREERRCTDGYEYGVHLRAGVRFETQQKCKGYSAHQPTRCPGDWEIYSGSLGLAYVDGVRHHEQCPPEEDRVQQHRSDTGGK